MFFDYASYTSAIVWMLLFGYPLIKSSILRWRERARDGKKPSVNHQYSDQLNVLMRAYPEVPLGWYMILFMASFVIIITLLIKGYMFIPIWTYFIAMATGAIVVVVSCPRFTSHISLPADITFQPLGWLYAISNFQLVSIFVPQNNTSPFCSMLTNSSPSARPTSFSTG